jgi:hypothetical protein
MSKNSPCDPSSASIARLNGLTRVNLQEAVARPWSAVLCALPQAVWLQRSATITSKAPCTSNNQDPAPNRQKAITPRLLRALFNSSGTDIIALRDSAPSITTNLVLGSFFFACWACEYTKTKLPGKTKVIVLGSVIFRSKTKQTLPPSTPDLLNLAAYVTIIFVEQKSGKKMDARTQRRTGHPFLRPILRSVSLVQRVLRTIPNATNNTPISTMLINTSILLITSTYVCTQLRHTCRTFGGKAVFGIDAHEIGNKSIRSGAAMSLFLNNTETDRIMILGRWSSNASLAYIWPQVLERIINMSRSMVRIDSFFDATDDPNYNTTETGPNGRPTHFNGSHPVIMLRFDLNM